MNDNQKNKLKHSWIAWFSLFITVIAFAGWCYDHFSDNNPKLTFTIIKKISLINEEADISSFHILLDSIDIRKNNSNISIYSIKVSNDGKQHITNNMYDGKLRLYLQQGKFINKPIIADYSSPHINSHLLNLSFSNDSTLNLPFIPLDKNDYFILDLVILHSNDSLPLFDLDGKISGQKKLIVNRKLTNNTSFWEKVYDGGFWINLVRFILFFIFGCNIIIILLFLKEVPSYIRHQRKIKRIRKITAGHSVSQQVKKDFFVEDDNTLQIMYRLITYSDKKASKEYNKIQKILSSNENGPTTISLMTDKQRMILHMTGRGYWNLSGDKVIINKELQKDFKYLYKNIKKKSR